MKKIVLLAFVLVLLAVSMLGTRLVITVSGSTTHHVYPGQSIQEAINSAQLGDTIIVYAGTYYEHIIVNKAISFIGENRETTVIDGGGTGNVVHATVNRISISNFTIQGGGCACEEYSGLFLENSHNSTVTDNIITNNGWGIRLLSSSSCTIASNVVTDNNAHGIYLDNSNNNFVNGNKLIDNVRCGLIISMSNGCTVTSNEVSHNYGGIWLPSSYDNNIYHNDFISNTQQAWGFGLTNTWDDGYPSGGNYWSDYEKKYPDAEETDDSGIWDTPYEIDENNQDNYPLMNPWASEEEAPPPAEEETPFWMQWWFWTIVIAVIAVLAVVIYFLKKRKPPNTN